MSTRINLRTRDLAHIIIEAVGPISKGSKATRAFTDVQNIFVDHDLYNDDVLRIVAIILMNIAEAEDRTLGEGETIQ